MVLFAVFPAAVWGGLDPYLGFSLYTENLPSLQMELPVGNAGRFYQIYQAWGLDIGKDNKYKADNDFIPATTADGRHIVQIDNLQWSLRTMGSVGYPAVWSFRRWAASLCETLHQVEMEQGDDKAIPTALPQMRFLLQEPYSGWTLAESLIWALERHFKTKSSLSSSLLPPSPTTWVQQGCAGEVRSA